MTLPGPLASVLSDPASPADVVRLWADPALGIETTDCCFRLHRFSPHAHDTLMLGLIQRGAKSFARRRRMYEVGRKEISVVNAGEAHTGAPVGGELLRYRAIYVPQHMLSGSRPAEVRAATIRDPHLFALLWRGTELVRGNAPRLEKEEVLTPALRMLNERYAGAEPVGSMPAPAKLLRARDFLRENLESDVSVGEIASAVGFSPYHLMRSFQRHFGMPMYAYRIGERVHRARELLRFGDEPVDAIALACGFADQSHFTRRFKSVLGVTPAAYRRAFRA